MGIISRRKEWTAFRGGRGGGHKNCSQEGNGRGRNGIGLQVLKLSSKFSNFFNINFNFNSIETFNSKPTF